MIAPRPVATCSGWRDELALQLGRLAARIALPLGYEGADGGRPRPDIRQPRRRLDTGAAGCDDEDERARREEKALHPLVVVRRRCRELSLQNTKGTSIFVERLYAG